MSKLSYWVIIPAAGSGSRMLKALPKQYLSILGKTIIEHTLDVFLESSVVTQITVCLSADDQHFTELGVNDNVATTTGGASRAQSVLNGLRALNANDSDWVLVHDAARPCFNSELLERLVGELSDDRVGGIMAIPVKDTLKQSNTAFGSSGGQRIQTTVDRSQIWQAQTPQMFRYKLLKDALSAALAAGVEITDEASAIEWSGLQPKLVQGDARNIKVTTPEDLVFTEFLLRDKGSTIGV